MADDSRDPSLTAPDGALPPESCHGLDLQETQTRIPQVASWKVMGCLWEPRTAREFDARRNIQLCGRKTERSNGHIPIYE